MERSVREEKERTEGLGPLRLAGLILFTALVFFFAYGNPLSGRTREEILNPDPSVQVSKVRSGNLPRRIAFVLLGAYGAAALLFGSNSRSKRGDAILKALVAAFLLLAGASMLWAGDKALAGRRLVVLGLSVIGAAGIGFRWPLRSILRWAFFVVLIQVGLGLGWELATGEFQPFAPRYRFAGTLHPNHQALNCCLLALSGFLLYVRKERFGLFYAAAAAAGLLLCILTGSRTGFVSTVAALGLAGAITLRPMIRGAVLTGALSALCLAAVFFEGELASKFMHGILLGREERQNVKTLTGRLPLWKELSSFVTERPLLGYGYGAFWTPRRIIELSYRLDWGISEAHNAYLDMTLSLGIAGALLFAAILLRVLISAFKALRASGALESVFPVSLGVAVALDGLLESASVNPTLFAFVFMVVLAHIALAARFPGECVPELGNAEESRSGGAP